MRERLRLTAFLLVALAGLLPALPALRTAVDEGTAASAGTAASRLLLGGVIVAVLGAVIAIADQRISISPARRRMLGRAAAVAVAIAAVLVIAVGLQKDAPTRIQNAWHSFTLVDAQSDAGPHLLSVESNRWDFWGVAADDLKARPLNGYGAGSFGPTYLRNGNSSEMPAQAHGQAAGAGRDARPARACCSAAPWARSAWRACCAVARPPRRRSRAPPSAWRACSRTRRSTGTGRCRPSRCPWWRCSPAAPRCTRSAPRSRAAPRASAAGGARARAALGPPRFAAERLIERAVDNERPRGRAPRGESRRSTRLRSGSPPTSSRRHAAWGMPSPQRGAGPQEWSSWVLVAQLAGNDKALAARPAPASAENPRLTSCT